MLFIDVNSFSETISPFSWHLFVMYFIQKVSQMGVFPNLGDFLYCTVYDLYESSRLLWICSSLKRKRTFVNVTISLSAYCILVDLAWGQVSLLCSVKVDLLLLARGLYSVYLYALLIPIVLLFFANWKIANCFLTQQRSGTKSHYFLIRLRIHSDMSWR